MKKLEYFVSSVLLALGVLHTALTPVLAKAVNSPPVEFVAIGVMFILVGLINTARLKTGDKFIISVSLISNILGFGWICLGFVYGGLHGEFFQQGILPAICLIVVILFSVLGRLKVRESVLG